MADFDKLAKFLDSLPGDFSIPGCDLSVWKDHKQIFRHFAGERHPGVPMDGTEFYHYYSCSKLSTMIACLKLIENGQISLSDPLYKYLPEYEIMTYTDENGKECPVTNPITIEHCMTMTAGFGYEYDHPAFKALYHRYGRGFNTRQFVNANSKLPLLFRPGEKFYYSLAHDVLGAVIEVVSGMSFGEYLQTYLYGPLDIYDVSFHPTREQQETLSKYMAEEEKLNAPMIPAGDYNVHNLSIPSDLIESGGGGLMGPNSSYIKVMDMLAGYGTGYNGNHILKKETVEMCMVNRLTDSQREDKKNLWPIKHLEYGWGLCGRVKTDPAGKTPIGEFGWCGMTGCYALADPINGISMFYTHNVSNYSDITEVMIQPVFRDMVYDILGL